MSAFDDHYRQRKLLKIAGIGSRHTPPAILDEMEKIGRWCNQVGATVRSGHAIGADWAFEKGATDASDIFIPWLNFCRDRPYLGRVVVVASSPELDELVRRYHPNHFALKRGAFALMRRNSCQVLGEKLNDPVDAVVCWTRDGKASGGTGQALRIAIDHQIPILNMYADFFSTAERVIDFLKSPQKMSLVT